MTEDDAEFEPLPVEGSEGEASTLRPPEQSRSTTTTRALLRYRPDPTQADRPWLLAIVDQPETRTLVSELETRLVKQFRVAICPTVTAGAKLIEACNEAGDPVAVVLSEEPLAGMSGGGLWGLQKCRSLRPEAVRLLGVNHAESLLKVAIDKLRDADVHQVFSLSTPPDLFIQQILAPLTATHGDAIDESLRSATVRATSDVKLLKIPKETFWELLLHDSRLSLGITRELARRLRKLQN